MDENEPADKKLIVEILKPYVTIDKEGIISFLDKYENLKSREKILVYLICRKAMTLKNIIDTDEEPMSPKGISQNARISGGSAKDISRDVILKKIVKKEKRKYSIPNYNLKKVKEVFIKNEAKE